MSTPPRDRHECGGDAAAYVLGALESAEAAAFRRHLEECVVCRDEVEALTGVVQALPMAAPQHAAPRRLRRRVLRSVRQQHRLSAAVRGSAHGRRGPLAGVVALHPRALAAGALAVVAAVAAAVGIAIGVGGAPGTGTRVIEASVSGISGSVQLRVSAHRGELVARHLSAPRRGHVYEVWLKQAGRAPRPAGVLFTVNARGGADVSIPESLRGVGAVLVTPEPAGGTRVPTHTPVIVAQLT
ncbi:MAG: anti-sigma factor domain-containing protein [Solirubrobacteraceae bacterium]